MGGRHLTAINWWLGILPNTGRPHAQWPSVQVRLRCLEALQAISPQICPWPSTQVCHWPPLANSLVLEAGRSLRLFGGFAALARQVVRQLEPLGVAVSLAGAPTPLAARWLAWQDPGRCVRHTGELAAAIDRLPAWLCTQTGEQTLLHELGLVTLGQLRCLPRAGLAHRLGPAALQQLDRALGLHPDPQTPWQPHARCQVSLELPWRLDSSTALRPWARLLLQRVERWLQTRRYGLVALCLHCLHDDLPASQLELRLAHARADLKTVERLLHERLARLDLPAPVQGLLLQVLETAPLPDAPVDLFHDSPHEPTHAFADWQALLQSRLGHDAICQPASLPDPRPERAGPLVAVQGRASRNTVLPNRLPRPLWLLPQPQALTVQHHQPWYRHAPLQLLAGPERIECGWWEDEPDRVLRDYFIAEDTAHCRHWIFRLRQDAANAAERWFLHGHYA